MSVLAIARSRLVFLIFLTVLCGGALSVPTASAGPLEAVAGVTGPVTEAVEPVREVVENIPSPVRETVEAVTTPAQDATQATPPVKEVTEAVKAPVEAVAEAVGPPAKALAETVRHPPAVPAVKPPSETVNQVVGAVGKAVSSAGSIAPLTESVNRTAREKPDGVTPRAASQDDATPGPTPLSGDRTVRQGTLFVPSPARDGSTAAPLPKWVAYIWPAVALTPRGLAVLIDRWETAARIALRTSEVSEGAAGIGPVVAGVHASGGRPEADDSSSSPFSKVTSAVGKFPYNASGAALGYIVIVAIMLIALFVAVRWEIANGRREGRGQ